MSSGASLDHAAFDAGLKLAAADFLKDAEADLEHLADAIVGRAKSNLPDGAMREAVGKESGIDAEGPYVDVGVLPGSGLVTSGGADPADAAVPFEWGHRDGGAHVPPHPVLRPAIADAIATLPAEVGK